MPLSRETRGGVLVILCDFAEARSKNKGCFVNLAEKNEQNNFMEKI